MNALALAVLLSASSGPAAPSSEQEARLLRFPDIHRFSAQYSGSRQVYVMPAAGGAPRQLTFYTDVGPMPPRGGWDYWMLGWTREGARYSSA